MFCYCVPPLTLLRNKVDLTKYIEEHQFVFDQVFDETVSN